MFLNPYKAVVEGWLKKENAMFLNPYKAVVKGWLKGVVEDDIQPNAVDIHITQLYRMDSSTPFYLFKEGRSHRRRTLVSPRMVYQDAQCASPMWCLDNGTYDFVSPVYVEIPAGVCGWLITRSTLNRNGIFIHSGLYDSGFKGPVSGTIYVLGGQTFIEPSSRIAQFILGTSDSFKLYTGEYNTSEGELPS